MPGVPVDAVRKCRVCSVEVATVQVGRVAVVVPPGPSEPLSTPMYVIIVEGTESGVIMSASQSPLQGI
jgi:hypothetical protein